MKKQSLQFGEMVEGYAVPVLNEREIRASAGILFLVLFMALMQIIFKQDFLLVKYVVLVFLSDFTIRIFISPRFSPVLIIGRIIVGRQTPEYVAAPQKKFAWKIGFALSCLMFFLLVIVNSYSIITSISCFACLIFLFFESAFGICLGCLFYGLFYKTAPLHCSGEVCEPAQKHAIHKVSKLQIVVVLIAIAVVFTTIVLLNERLGIPPRSLKQIIGLL